MITKFSKIFLLTISIICFNTTTYIRTQEPQHINQDSLDNIFTVDIKNLLDQTILDLRDNIDIQPSIKLLELQGFRVIEYTDYEVRMMHKAIPHVLIGYGPDNFDPNTSYIKINLFNIDIKFIKDTSYTLENGYVINIYKPYKPTLLSKTTVIYGLLGAVATGCTYYIYSTYSTSDKNPTDDEKQTIRNKIVMCERQLAEVKQQNGVLRTEIETCKKSLANLPKNPASKKPVYRRDRSGSYLIDRMNRGQSPTSDDNRELVIALKPGDGEESVEKLEPQSDRDRAFLEQGVKTAWEIFGTFITPKERYHRMKTFEEKLKEEELNLELKRRTDEGQEDNN